MSAPTPAPGDDLPREGYYPDPSIPGYVRYWNGMAWVPGTSRPAPSDGRPLSPPSGRRPASPSVEETGPHFFDEDPIEEPRGEPIGEPLREPAGNSAPDAPHGPSGKPAGDPSAAPPGANPSASRPDGRPEPASAWGADRSRQSGFGGEQDRRVSWGAPQGPDPRIPLTGGPEGTANRTDGTATIPPAGPAAGGDSSSAAPEGTMVFRRPRRDGGSGTGTPSASGTDGPVPSEDTMTFRALSPRKGEQGGNAEAADSGPGRSAATPTGAQSAARQALGLNPQSPEPTPPAPRGPTPPAPRGPESGLPGRPAPGLPRQSTGSPHQHSVGLPQQSTGPGVTPMSAGAGGGQPSWAQQVHRLAGPGPEGEQPVAPWKPPVDDVFQAAARAHAAARPAGLGKRLAARLLDTLVLAAVTGVAAVPLGTRSIDHIHAKVEAARMSGQTVTVWLLDGTTSVHLAVVLAVLLGFGVLYEVLPTAKWGRTLGKRLCGIEVRDIEAHEPPDFGRALRRWLVYSVPGLLVVGVVGVLWCLFDRPWHQCWHDKVAHTFVAR
ncbi:RDD family protein [Streptomyces nodosus]|uniref:RDD family protein n=1 Tax=Streptomyces nodosus TaxID=40318 RepID=UPI0034537B1C